MSDVDVKDAGTRIYKYNGVVIRDSGALKYSLSDKVAAAATINFNTIS